LLERGPDPRWISDHFISLRKGNDYQRDTLLSKLFDAGYQRESLVDGQGQFAVRGSLIDIFPYGFENPIRVELDFDEIASRESANL